MRCKFFCGVVAIALAAVLMTAPAQAQQLAPYSQDFEGLVQSDGGALAGDGWLVTGNVFDANGNFIYFYGGVFPAPNGGPAFSGIDTGQGGPDQGAQQLVVYSDYNNGDHGNCFFAPPFDATSPTCRFIEANVWQEQLVGAADVGNTWLFEYDAKRGNIGGVTEAKAWFKTLDPNNGFALTNFIWNDMTNVPETWDRYTVAIDIDASLVGQILQFGFLTYTTAYNDSGIFYDNINFRQQPLSVSLDIKPGSCPNPLNNKPKGVVPAALLGTLDFDVNSIDVDSLRLAGVAPLKSSYEDVAQPYGGDLCGCNELGSDGFLDLKLKFSKEELLDAVGSSPSGDLLLTMTGTLLDGTPIEGEDCVFILQGGARPIRSDIVEPGGNNLDFQLAPIGGSPTSFR